MGRRGYLLLEVVMSVALLVLGLAVIGAQFQQGRDAAHRTEEMTRVLMLAESKLAELDTGLVALDEEADDETEGDFTLRFPSYGWRMRFQETATEGLRMITLEILFAPREDLDDDFDFDNAKVLHSFYTLRAVPALADLEADYGLDEQAIEQIREALPDPDIDVEQFDITKPFRELPIEELIAILPTLLGALGISPEAMLNMAPPDVRELLKEGLEMAGELDDGAADEGRPSRGTVDPRSLKEGRGR